LSKGKLSLDTVAKIGNDVAETAASLPKNGNNYVEALLQQSRTCVASKLLQVLNVLLAAVTADYMVAVFHFVRVMLLD